MGDGASRLSRLFKLSRLATFVVALFVTAAGLFITAVVLPAPAQVQHSFVLDATQLQGKPGSSDTYVSVPVDSTQGAQLLELKSPIQHHMTVQYWENTSTHEVSLDRFGNPLQGLLLFLGILALLGFVLSGLYLLL